VNVNDIAMLTCLFQAIKRASFVTNGDVGFCRVSHRCPAPAVTAANPISSEALHIHLICLIPPVNSGFRFWPGSRSANSTVSEPERVADRGDIPGIDVRERPQEFKSGQGVGHARWRSPARNHTQTTDLALEHAT